LPHEACTERQELKYIEIIGLLAAWNLSQSPLALALDWHYSILMSGFQQARITSQLCDRLRPGEVVADVHLPGYCVRRQTDAAVYFVRKYAHGRRHYVTIGTHGREGWTEAKARQAALLIIAALKQGRDPASERTKSRAMPTLAEAAAGFIEANSARLKAGTLANYQSLLRTHVAPAGERGAPLPGCLGRLRLDQVSGSDIAALHRRLRKTPVRQITCSHS
jgi:hypothetical protein